MRISSDSARGAIWKRLLLLFVSILTLLGLVNGVWYFGYKNRYNRIAEHLSEYYLGKTGEPAARRYETEVEEYRIGMKMPAYLGRGGFISIGKTEDMLIELDETGEIEAGKGMRIMLWIYPKYFRGFELYLTLEDDAEDVHETVELTPDLRLKDETLEEILDPEELAELSRRIEANRDEIQRMLALAEKTLEIRIADD